MAATKLRRLMLTLCLSAPALALTACSPPAIPDDPAGGGDGAFGRSPTSVQLKWDELKTAEAYKIFDLNRGNNAIYSTTFTEANLEATNGFVPNKEYTLSVRGVRGTGGKLSDPLNTWTFRTWTEFTNVTFTTMVDGNGTTSINWIYAPWANGLPASEDAAVGSEISCNLLPVDAGTDPSTVDVNLIRASATVVRGQLYPQTLAIQPGDIDGSKTYAAMCKAKFVDNTESASGARFIINPIHLVSPCPSTVAIGANTYSCTPNILRGNPSMTALGPYQVTIVPAANWCSWATTTPTSGATPYTQIIGSPSAANLGTCKLTYYYTIPSTGYVSPRLTQDVTVTAPEAYTIFPSFAVRAMSGALGYPHLRYQLTGNAADDTRARVKGDLVTDFGYGSSYFVGGSNPFPEFDPAITSNPLGTGFFYGFPVAKSSGTRPNGYSLDGIRQSSISNGNPVNEGFLRGNMVIPNVQISHPTFLSQSGHVGAFSLNTFLTNAYTFNGSSESRVPLSQYLKTAIDFPADPLNDPTPTFTPWAGSVLEQTSVTIKAPTAAALLAHVPPSDTVGQPNEIANADPNKTVTGLVKVPVNGFDFYASNCTVPADLSDAGTAPAVPGLCAAEIAARPSPIKANAIACYGDVIVQLPMRLSDAVFITDAGGCRLHSTSSIFIQGTIKAITATGARAPLQISSSRAIVVGFSQNLLGVTNIGTRAGSGTGLINQNFANSTANPFLTSANDAAGSASAALDLIARDAYLTDLGTSDISPYASSSRELDYLVLNAPYVFSNYRGKFTGAIIAEVALFTELNFIADPRLKGVTPFPMLTGTDAVLKVTP
jgi:hypothetical protein